MTPDETSTVDVNPESPKFPDNVPVLLADGIRLRAHSDADAQRVVEQSSDPASQRFVALPSEYDMDAALGFIHGFVEQGWNEGKRFEFAIDDLSSGTPVFCGNVGVGVHGRDRYEIGWIMHPDARGKGIVTRAARRLLKWVFEEQHAQTVLWRADVDNFGSDAVAQKIGFPEPVVLEQWIYLAGELRDCAMSTLTRERYFSLAD